MAGVTQSTLRGQVVFYDSQYSHRIVDAIGPDVVKWMEDGVTLHLGDSNSNATAYTTTETGTNTIALTAGADAGNIVLTTGGTTNNKIELQLLGEAFKFEHSYPVYFGIKFKLSDVSEVCAIAGLCITDTTLTGGLSEGMYFRSADTESTLCFVAEKGSNETSVTAATMTDATWITAEFYYDGTTCTGYIDGSSIGSIADTDVYFPDSEYLTPSLAILTGEDTANTFTIEWARAFMFRN